MKEAEYHAAASAAFNLHRAGRLDAAEAGYRAILEARPDAAEILQLLGTLLGQSERLNDARDTLLRATALAPENADAQYNLAECLFRLGDVSAATHAYRAALAAHPAHTEAAIGLSGLLMEAGDASSAADVARAALTHAFDHPLLLTQLGAALLDMDRPAEARDHLERALRLAPDHVLAKRNLASALIELEAFEQALEILRPLVNAKPRSVELLQLAALALSASGQYTRAKPAVERILEIEPENIVAINMLSDIASRMGDGDLALEQTRRAAELTPDSAHAAARLAHILERMSKLEEASDWIDRALDLEPANALARVTAARIARRSGDTGSALALLEQIDTAAESDWLAANILFERGQTEEALERHDAAFATFEAAHATRAKTYEARRRDAESHAATQQALLDIFKAKDVRQMIAAWATDVPADGLATPSFLVGYPRSGTTLVERLLDAHEGVTATPELPMVNAMRNALDAAAPGGVAYPQSLARIGTEEIRKMRALYWGLLHDTHIEEVGDRQVVDKHPLNLDHLGLIARTFTGAKVLVALRDPRDVCVSCFTTDFFPNNVTIRFHSLAETARAYAATMRLWMRYRDILPLEFHTYRYEDLARNPREELGRIVDFFGLDWHDALLESADRNVGHYVTTPSYTGVTERVNTRAVGRWRGYAGQLEPVIPLLEPFIEAFGYDE
ncbi:MAG: hypothetical protein CMM26_05840 [Rhodospirillaceae bacterium]|mgnify:CR=1 FL=1|nr:hypothetical protein [Rhodospirillaceae bacterium]